MRCSILLLAVSCVIGSRLDPEDEDDLERELTAFENRLQSMHITDGVPPVAVRPKAPVSGSPRPESMLNHQGSFPNYVPRNASAFRPIQPRRSVSVFNDEEIDFDDLVDSPALAEAGSVTVDDLDDQDDVNDEESEQEDEEDDYDDSSLFRRGAYQAGWLPSSFSFQSRQSEDDTKSKKLRSVSLDESDSFNDRALARSRVIQSPLLAAAEDTTSPERSKRLREVTPEEFENPQSRLRTVSPRRFRC